MNDHQPSPKTVRSVLLVLEDTTVAHAFARILESRSHLAVTASTRVHAAELMPADIVIAEVGSQAAKDAGLDGIELVETLRGLGHDPITILLADDPTQDELNRTHDMGIDAILDRPVLPEALVYAVENVPCYDEEATDQLTVTMEASDFAGEAASRELLGWCLQCEVTPAARARIGTATAEVIQNAADHGAKNIEMVATMSPRELRIDVIDDGPGFDAVEVLTGDGLDSSTGLGRAHSLADEVEIRSTFTDGTRVSMAFRVSTVEFDQDGRIDLSDLDFFVPATSKELLATLSDEPEAPIVLSPALAVVVGRLLMGPDPRRVLEGALRA